MKELTPLEEFKIENPDFAFMLHQSNGDYYYIGLVDSWHESVLTFYQDQMSFWELNALALHYELWVKGFDV